MKQATIYRLAGFVMVAAVATVVVVLCRFFLAGGLDAGVALSAAFWSGFVAGELRVRVERRLERSEP